MKRTIPIILGVLLMLILAACNEKADPVEKEVENEEGASAEKEKANKEKESETTLKEVEKDNNDEPMGIQSDTLLDDVPPIPTKFEEIVAYPVGPFSGNGNYAAQAGKTTLSEEELVEEVFNALPSFTKEQLDEPGFIDRWFSAFHYLIAEDFKDPQFIVDEMALHSFGKPMINGKLIDFKEQLNVLIIFDASGSMANAMQGQTMMAIAQKELTELIDGMPDNVNIGLRVYGGGERSDEAKCSATKLSHPIASGNKAEIKATIAGMEPGGWTPIGESLKQAAQDFADFSSETNTNFIYLISDGVETCDGDPEKEAEQLRKSNIEPIINVIGFNVDMNGQHELKKIAEQGQGQYIHVADTQAFADSMKSIEAIVQAWENQKFEAIDDAITAKGKVSDAIYDLQREWMNKKDDEYNVMMHVFDKMNSSDEYFEDKDAFNEAHDTILQKITDINRLYLEEFEQKNKDLNDNLDEAFKDILEQLE
ncbi:vWA domain-containing protein [Bacillus norwichensis]|uniref:VWA domain-containing protein n=1 Tax=Bacillus norwichensis TaxID=2762217 RepID=A0ABR8VLU3_9BACI|nr:VWA domain-containing protein [Bacillus norwichensis]MBD8005747.1 VWA domain-containing protein [Bacillus norwichensis]